MSDNPGCGIIVGLVFVVGFGLLAKSCYDDNQFAKTPAGKAQAAVKAAREYQLDNGALLIRTAPDGTKLYESKIGDQIVYFSRAGCDWNTEESYRCGRTTCHRTIPHNTPNAE